MPIIQTNPLGFQWDVIDPFLFCVHHNDAYPAGDARMALPAAARAGRQIGQDFSNKDGFSMYHGGVDSGVPGFPAHPHRGFETVTIVRRGLIDHSDSLGATARFGGSAAGGDVQWLTAGRGIVHCEMFPLLSEAKPNPLELFQIWLNLPAKSKMAPPNFTMLWAENIPRHVAVDTHGRRTEVTIIAGALPIKDAALPLLLPLKSPPDSWAARAEADIAIWTIRMAPGARWTLPAAVGKTTRRKLYFFSGNSVEIAGKAVKQGTSIELQATAEVVLVNGDTEAEFLLLQGRPIGEPVAQYGPFVMNTQAEIKQAIADYQRTQFGGWPWAGAAPTHVRERGRFARRPDGVEEATPIA